VTRAEGLATRLRSAYVRRQATAHSGPAGALTPRGPGPKELGLRCSECVQPELGVVVGQILNEVRERPQCLLGPQAAAARDLVVELIRLAPSPVSGAANGGDQKAALVGCRA